MNKDIHPKTYRTVMFKDTSNGQVYLVPSVIESEKTEKHTDGNEYPLVEVEVSSTSHPFYTGDTRIMDTAGRAERFRKKLAATAKNTVAAKKVKKEARKSSRVEEVEA